TQEGTPLAYDGVLYMPNPNDVIQAIDAVTGDLRWEYRRELPEDINDYVNGASTNRNIAIYGNRIIDTGADNFLYALDAETGRLAWETQILDYLVNPARHSSGPIVAGGKAISGRSCRPHGGPEACVITAHDAETGEEVWRRRLVPAPGEPGDETWGGVPYEERVHVGSWMAPSYDPELNLVYVGTSVTSPAPKFLLGGVGNSYLYHNSTLALHGDTGEIVWYYQHLNDHWDLDHPFERLLVDTAVAPDPAAVSWINPRLEPGEARRVLTGIPGKTGVVYTLDRETGEFLWARPTVTQNVISDIDGATGDVTENAELIFGAEGQQVLACPSWFGGKDWEAGAYSPRTNTMYMPLRNTCARMLATRDAEIHYALAVRNEFAPGTDQLGTVQAISAETGATEWLHEQRAATMSLVATGGGLVFGGDVNGRFRAFDDETGEVLWEINLGSPVTGFPITYAVDGRQYVAVSTGTAGTASGFIRLTPELRPSAGNNLFVFGLP
ncbi:MAG: PQQ-binding-like beta-propeller repeat protein, partial [Acidobacteria bacterium]|nr:PQQ-binding-like beta-propeller repeat protein [Acidobacteriota bacterium]